MVKDMNSRAEGLWRESRGVLFFKGAYTLATHEGSWCYLCFVVLAEWLGADENIAVGSKWSSPSQHRVSLASMTSQSQKSHLQPVCLAAVCLAAVCLGILNWQGKSTYIFVFNWSIPLGILPWEKNLCVRFQLCYSFGNTNVEKNRLYSIFN